MSINFDELCSYLYSHSKKKWIKYSKPTKAYLYKQDYRINILSLEKEDYKIKKFLKKLDKKKIFKTKSYEIYHLFYEFGHYLNTMQIDKEEILAIEIYYSERMDVPEPAKTDNIIKFHEISSPNREIYKKSIEQIQSEIKVGQYYQLNFTRKWSYQFFQSLPVFINKFFAAKEKIGSMAHVTIAPSLNTMWLSNSPECLFVAKKRSDQVIIDTYPIKGTSYLNKGFAKAKVALLESKKDLAELDMITDLMRNDLNKLQLPRAKVVKRRFFFSVPNLLQQASWVRGEYDHKLRLGNLIRAIFPGGSVTGAPKVSTMKAIDELEGASRAFYCGSTIYRSQNNCSASINIRSATVNLSDKTLIIGAGGGITLLSHAESEWEEMQAKKNSLLNIWE